MWSRRWGGINQDFSILTDSIFTLTSNSASAPIFVNSMHYENDDVMIYENGNTMIYE